MHCSIAFVFVYSKEINIFMSTKSQSRCFFRNLWLLFVFFVVAPSYGQPNPNSDKWINVDKIIAVSDGKIVTTSDVYILEKIAFCHGHNLKSTVFQIEDNTDYFFLYLLTLSLISEASSLYIIEEREIAAFLEADDSTKKSLQNTNQDMKATYDCSMNEIDSRRRLQIAESLMFLDIYLHDNFVMMPKERSQDFLERYYSFARQKIGKVQFVGDNLESESIQK